LTIDVFHGILLVGIGGSMRIEIPLPAPFYVITAKTETGEILVLRDVFSHYKSHWGSVINENTKKFDDKKSAKEIMEIQINNFPEHNKNLTVFKVRKIKPIYIFE